MASSETLIDTDSVLPLQAVAADLAWLYKVLPIVRVRGRASFSLGSGNQVLGIFRDALVMLRGRKARALPAGFYTAATANELVEKGLVPARAVMPLHEVTRAVIEPPSWLGQARLIVVAPHRRFTFSVPSHESPHPGRALGALLGDRAKFPRRIGFHVRPALAVLIVLLGFIEAFFVLSGIAPMVSVVIIGTVLAGFVGVVALDHLPKPVKDKPAAIAAHGPDRSGRPPLVSLTWGRTLRIAAVVIVALVFVLHDQIATALTRWLMPVITDDGSFLQAGVSVLVYSLYLAGMLLLYLGYRLSQRGARYVLASDERPPILYLRSFGDDERNNLNPETNLAALLGVRQPRWLPDRVGAFRYIFMLHPVRFLRMATGLAADTAEEQFALALRKRGPFVAIGKPGERFAAPGAARMYVTHDAWKEVVLDLMGQSQLVLLQPAKSEGIWWEVEQTLTRVEPQRVVLCMVNFKGRPNDYEAFRLRVEEVTGRPLPRQIGNLERPAIVYFDASGAAHAAELSYYSPLLWPLLLQVVDIRRTLHPVLAASAGAPPAEPALPARHMGHGFLAGVLYTVAIGVLENYVFDARRTVGESLAARFEGVPSTPFTPPTVSDLSYAGKALTYQITLDSSWRRLPTVGNYDSMFTRGMGVQIAILAVPGTETLGGLPETCTSNLSKSSGKPATLVSSGTVTRQGKQWMDILVKVEPEGGTELHHVYAYSGKEGTVILEGRCAAGKPEGDDSVRRAFEGLGLPGSTGRDGSAGQAGALVFRGSVVDYRIPADPSWRVIPTTGDLAFSDGRTSTLQVVAGPIPEDLSGFAASTMGGLVRELSADSVKALYLTRLRAAGLTWQELALRFRGPEGIRERRIRYQSSSRGTFILVATYPPDNATERARMARALDGFYLPAEATTPGAHR